MLQPKPRADRRPTRSAPAAAFTHGEWLIALVILLMMSLMCAAVVLIATRGIHYSRSYEQGVLIAQRMVELVQSEQYGPMSQDVLPAGLVDNGGVKTGVTAD